MKKIIALTLTAIMCFSLSAFSAGVINASVSNSEADGLLIRNIIVNGNCSSPNDRVAVKISDLNGNLKSFEQVSSDAEGAFQAILKFKGNADGESVMVYANSEKSDNLLSIKVDIPSNSVYSEIISSFNNSSDVAETKNLIDDNKDKLGFDTTYLNSGNEEDVAAKMFSSKGKFTTYNIAEKFDEAVILNALNGEKGNSYKREVLNYYDERYIGFHSQENTELVSSYNAFGDDMKDYAINRLSEKQLQSVKNILPEFNNVIIETAVAKYDTSDLDKFIINNNSYLGLNGYDSKTPAKRYKYAIAIKNAAPKNLDDLRKAYNQAVAADEQNSGNNPPSGGGGGGGSAKGYTQLPEITNANNAGGLSDEVIKPFNDLGGYEWAKEAIENLYSSRVINGKSSGKFFPADNVTRAEFVKMFTLAFGLFDEQAKCSFDDVPEDSWYYPYVASAVNSEMIKGVSETAFNPSAKISRQDIAVIIYRYLNLKRKIHSQGSITNNFTDLDEVAGYAQNSVIMLNTIGVINGKGDDKFCPHDNATRAEACVLIVRALEAIML